MAEQLDLKLDDPVWHSYCQRRFKVPTMAAMSALQLKELGADLEMAIDGRRSIQFTPDGTLVFV